MADGTTTPPAERTSPLRETRDMVAITLTDKFDSYCPPGGAQLNAGESASVPKAEAERLIQLGAAVRQSDPAASSSREKALSRPPSDKMQHAQAVK